MLGRPEAALVGVQYLASDNGNHNDPWTVTRSRAHEWLFSGTGLEPGMQFGRAGIEIDHTTKDSPRGIEVVAVSPHVLFGQRTAEMTYYETPAGTKVFAAGAFTLAGGALNQPVKQILDNLWQHLTTGD